MRILLVEDDALLADCLARALGQSGYLIDIASDGKTADAWLESETYDLAILDLGLPGLDGVEVLQRLRSRKQLVPVLILSAREALEERVRVLDLGADDYLVKPVALVELEARVRALIRRGQGAPGFRRKPSGVATSSMGWLSHSPSRRGRSVRRSRRRLPLP